MFDIGWTELVVIGIVALIVIGPRELPRTLRTIGQMMTRVRRMASEFQGQFNDAIREAELDELRKEAEKLTSGGSFDPLATAKSEIEEAFEAADKKPETSSTPRAPEAPPVVEAPKESQPAETLSEPKPEPAASGGGRAG
jgi:sec-independent protein translocase protein TatB